MSRSSRTTIAIVALLAGGCGESPPSGRQSPGPVPSLPQTVQPSARPHVMLILPTTNATDAEILRESIERLAAGGETPFVYREGFTRDGQPPQQQAEVVAESLKRKVQAMIVAPGDPASIGPALAEARDQGIAVVTIGPEIAVDGKRLPRIDLSPAEPPARRVVEQLLKDAGASGAAGGSAPAAILLTATGQQWHLQDAGLALEGALREAKVPIARIVRHGRSEPEARAAMISALSEHPEARLVLFDSDSGARAAQAVKADPKLNHRYEFGGFINQVDPRSLAGASALVRRRIGDLGEKAVKAALALLNRQPVTDRTEVEQSFQTGSPNRQDDSGREKALSTPGTAGSGP